MYKRQSHDWDLNPGPPPYHGGALPLSYRGELVQGGGFEPCLLYTSDAADERSSVDLGGRRIIKKKNDEIVACVWS